MRKIQQQQLHCHREQKQTRKTWKLLKIWLINFGKGFVWRKGGKKRVLKLVTTMIPQNGTVLSNKNELSIKTGRFISCEKEPKAYLKVFLPSASGIDWNCQQAKPWSNAKHSSSTCVCKQWNESTGGRWCNKQKQRSIYLSSQPSNKFMSCFMIEKVWKWVFPDQLIQAECNDTEATWSHLSNYKDQLELKKNKYLFQMQQFP